MSCRKDTLQASPETANKVLVKPEPPADLWERLEQIHQQLEIAAKGLRPSGSFTIGEYAGRFGISKSSARRKINTMIGAGKVKRIGNIKSSYAWYVLVGAK